MRKRSDAEKFLMDKVSIEDYWNKYVVPMFSFTRPFNADNLSSVCPFHSDSNPSLRYYPKTQSFYCYGCNTGGTIVDLHMHFLKVRKVAPRVLSRLEAIQDLGNLYNLELPSLTLTREQLEDIASRREYLAQLRQEEQALKEKKIQSIITFKEENKSIIEQQDSVDINTLGFKYDTLDTLLASQI